MTANCRLWKMVLPAVALAVGVWFGTARVAQATFICGGDGFFDCKDGGPNGVCQQGEQCDDGNTINGDGCDNNCMQTACGNGVTTAGEECDNGADNDDVNVDQSPFPGNACDTDCQLKACGNGRVEGGEQCDDGNAFNNDTCDSDPANVDGIPPDSAQGNCLLPVCGNGITNMNEMDGCDDGNTQSGDGCSATCESEFCGDGISNNAPNEECDDGNTVDDDDCENDCDANTCPDGTTDAGRGEECDDGNTVSGDGCGPTCNSEFCGDGISQPGEACDDGNTVADETCEPDCSKVPDCGDGVTDSNEGCDDGSCTCIAPKKASNGRSCATALDRTACTADGGACLNDATGLPCGTAAGDGNLDDVPDACRSTCESAACGDGVTDSGEVCDDGLAGPDPAPVDDFDECPNGSTMFFMGMECSMLNTCGDGIPNASGETTAPSTQSAGNTCDNGEGTAPKSCSVSGAACSLDSDCPAGQTCGNDDGTGGTCHATGFSDAECPNGAGLNDCACHPHYCGDGATDAGEGCDDGNTVDNDTGCQGDCALATCGDGITDTGEDCDVGGQNGMAGNNAGGPDCTSDCTFNSCGDGEALDTEECDDGDGVNTNDCTNACMDGVCGDGITRTGGSPILEQCDDGQQPPADQEEAGGTDDGCSARCCFEPTVSLGSVTSMLAAEECNVDHLADEVGDLPTSRASRRLSRHVASALKLQAKAEAGFAAGTTKGKRAACSAERRKDRITVCIQRALDGGLIRGEIDAATHREITQKALNIHGWVQNIRNAGGCF